MMVAVFNILLVFAASDTLYLSELHKQAEENWPIYAQMDRSEQISDLRLESLRKTWLPEIHAGFSVQYHSEVTNIPFSVPGLVPPSQPHDRYTATVEVQQMIWDGGAASKRAELEKKSQNVNKQKVAVELYQLKDQVNEVFFSIQLLEQRLISMDIITDELEERLNMMKSRVESGVVLQSEADILQLEIYKVRQSVVELKNLKSNAFDMLGILTGRDFMGTETLVADDLQLKTIRPELALFDAQINSIRASMALTGINLMPKISAFGQGGIGRPGPDIFNDAFRPYFVAGIQGKWQLWDWNRSRRDRSELSLGIKSVEESRAAFLRRQSMLAAQQNARISTIREQISLDDEIIRLRDLVVKSNSVQLEHGAITSTEYLIGLNAAHQSRLQRKIREIELYQAQTALKTINITVE